MNLTFPNYHTNFGLPFFWRDEVSGILELAVTAYLGYRCNTGPEPTPDQVSLLREYFRHWINAPCWSENEGFEEEMAHLKSSIDGLTSCDQLAAWIKEALEIGLDPL